MAIGGENPRVLVIDDERALRELLSYGLQHAGFNVRCASNGTDALALLQSWPPDVIVLDVMLPDHDGFALLPEIRDVTTAPVLMLTARTEVAERVAGLMREPTITSASRLISKNSSRVCARPCGDRRSNGGKH